MFLACLIEGQLELGVKEGKHAIETGFDLALVMLIARMFYL